MNEKIEISKDAVQFFATVGGVAGLLLVIVWLVQSCRPSQAETEDEQLDIFRRRTKRIKVPRRGYVDRIMDDGHSEHMRSTDDHIGTNDTESGMQ